MLKIIFGFSVLSILIFAAYELYRSPQKDQSVRVDSVEKQEMLASSDDERDDEFVEEADEEAADFEKLTPEEKKKIEIEDKELSYDVNDPDFNDEKELDINDESDYELVDKFENV